MLYQKLMEGSSGEESVVLFWSFMVEMKSCELALRLQVERHNEDEIIIGVESVEEKGERVGGGA